MADTGWKFPGTMTNVQVTEDLDTGRDWSDPDNAKADDGSNAAATMSGNNDFTDDLKASNFDFSSIPAGHSIDGIEIRVGDYDQSSTDAIWLELILILADDTKGSLNRSGEIPPPDTNSIQTAEVGGLGDKWGENPTRADVQDVDFGFTIQMIMDSPSPISTMRIDFLQMRIFHSAPGLPKVITTAGVPGHNPPRESSGGNFYVVAPTGPAASDLDVYKATDPADSFAIQDEANHPTQIQSWDIISTYQVGDIIHIATWGTNIAASYQYHTFNMADDTWGVVAEVIDDPTNDPTHPWIVVSVRDDGDIIVAYAGDTDQIMGGKKERVDYARREGGSWGGNTGIALDAAGDIHYGNPSIVWESSVTRMHVIWQKTENIADPPTAWTDMQGRSIRNDNTLGSVVDSAIDSGGVLLGLGNFIAIGAGLGIYQIGTASVETIINFRVASDDLTSMGGGSQISVTDPFANGEVGLVALAYDSVAEDFHALWSGGGTDGVDQDLYYKFGDNFTTWSDQVEELNGVTINFLSATIYTRGGNTVLAYVYDDAGVTKYNEKVVVSGGVAGVAVMRMALRSLLAGDKTAAQVAAASIALRPAEAAAKTSTSQPSARIALRGIIAAIGAQVFDAVARISLALRSASAAAKTSTSQPSASVALRSSSVGAKTTAAIARASVALRSLIDAVQVVVIEGVAVARLALRSLAAADKAADSTAVDSLALRSSTAADKTSDQIVRASIATRASDATNKVSTGIAKSSLALRSLIAAIGAAVVEGVVVARLALRSFPAAAKTNTGIIFGRMALRSTTAANKAADAIAKMSAALASSTAANKVSSGIAAASLAMRTAIDEISGTVFSAIAKMSLSLRSLVDTTKTSTTAPSASIALRGTSEAAKTSTGTATARLATRAQDAASKTTSSVVLSRMALRGFFVAAAGFVVNGIAQMSLALRSLTATNKAADGTTSASVALRSGDAAAKTTASAAIARLALRSLLAAVAAGAFNGIVRMSLAIRPTSAATKTASGISKSSMALKGATLGAKTHAAIVRASLALRSSIDEISLQVFDAIVRASLSLRATSEAAAVKISAIHASMALRQFAAAGKTFSGVVLGRFAIRPTNSGQKTFSGVAFNRMALRARTEFLLGELGTISSVCQLDGVFDPRVPLDGLFSDCSTDGLFDPVVSLSGEADPV